MEDIIQKTIKEKSSQAWWRDSDKKVIGKYGKMFDPQNLDNLTKEDFKSFLLLKNNLHWEGIQRQGNIITADMQKLRNTLTVLLDENLPLRNRLAKILDKNESKIKGLGRAVITPILLVVYPSKYGVWNSRSENALQKMNLFPRFSPKDEFPEKYIKVNEKLNELAAKYNISLWQLDGVLGEISGNGPFKAVDNGEGVAIEENEILDQTNFPMESHLEDFLIENWEKTIFGKEYDLIYDEGDLMSQQYQTEVGPIDILAVSKDKTNYLVVELKKGKPSDYVVGQILRYMSWIKKNLAQEKGVKGSIIVLETDNKLKYSLMNQQNIDLYTYKVDFHLSKEEIQ